MAFSDDQKGRLNALEERFAAFCAAANADMPAEEHVPAEDCWFNFVSENKASIATLWDALPRFGTVTELWPNTPATSAATLGWLASFNGVDYGSWVELDLEEALTPDALDEFKWLLVEQQIDTISQLVKDYICGR